MKVLLVGQGAREHAIADALKRSKNLSALFAYMEMPNPGICRLAEHWRIGKLNDLEALKQYAMFVQPDLVMFGPETPLAAGAVDELERKGFKCVGPRKKLALLEADKSFMREFLGKHFKKGYPKWQIFTNVEDLRQRIMSDNRIVLKPVGLTGGKGVKVFGKQLLTLDEALDYAKLVLEKDGKILVEEKVEGEEFSLMVFTDGQKIIPMPLVQDYKYAYDGDVGPMTGGMGSFSQADHALPFVSQQMFEEALDLLNETIHKLLEQFGVPYKGILYGQFMQTEQGPKVIEFNVRFGDPEAMNVLAVLKSDLLDILASIANGDLVSQVEFDAKATVCKYLVPKGYPEQPLVGYEFELPERELEMLGIKVYFASVVEKNGVFVTTSSRSVALLKVADNPLEGKKIIDEHLAKHCPSGLFYRKDIPRVSL
jgi:phosphoribosylamine--glycine ligase